MTIAAQPIVEPDATPSGSLISFLDLLACPLCRRQLDLAGPALKCVGCERLYKLLPDGGAPVLLPSHDFDYEDAGPARELKFHVEQRFAMIDQSLPEPYDKFATFLNLGYVADDSPQFAVRGPARPLFNRNSAKLLFEVLGATELDRRSVVELGCGRGGNLATIDRHYDSVRTLGIDLSGANVEFCRRQHTLSNGMFAVGDVEYVPVRDGAADVVLNLESSHYYPNRAKFFRETFRILKPGGIFLYADILEVQEFEEAEHYCREAGFETEIDRDISGNVLLSCREIAKIRESRQEKGIYETFLVIPGRPEFEALRTGATKYKITQMKKLRE
jgi:SAM-dependent methyltransferase/uncharacterized protein YbaR (Trm112 family)